MKYFCHDCKSVINGIERNERIEGFLRPYYVCEHCGSENISEAEKCQVCGEYVSETHFGICDDCQEWITAKFVDVMEEIEKTTDIVNDPKRGDIVEAMATCFEDFYNKYRFE